MHQIAQRAFSKILVIHREADFWIYLGFLLISWAKLFRIHFKMLKFINSWVIISFSYVSKAIGDNKYILNPYYCTYTLNFFGFNNSFLLDVKKIKVCFFAKIRFTKKICSLLKFYLVSYNFCYKTTVVGHYRIFVWDDKSKPF